MIEAMTTRSTRRGFTKLFLGTIAVASTISTTMTETACTFGSVFTAILKYVAVGLQAFQAVVDLLSGAGVLPIGSGTALDLAVALVKAGFADLQIAVTNYDNALAADKAILLGKISTALATVEASIQKFWNDLQIPDAKLSSLVQGLLGIIVTALGGFATQLPAPAPTPAITTAAQLPKRIAVPAEKLTPHEFKKRFNGLLILNGYQQHVIH